ncbi:MAG TPA: uracil-DNA glycosylase [Ktedonobacterales bacterium]|jgi:DNA polymerase
MTEAEALDAIARDTETCTRCPLSQGARHAVPGTGDPHAELLFIGEYPSAYDDRSGRPFSGPTGAFLDELLALVGLDRSRIFLTNVVKHRVPDGRPLAPSEIAACAGYLTRQIAAVRPKVIVALGRSATLRYFPKGTISQLHGRFKPVGSQVVVAMYNPAAALHREELRAAVVHDFTTAIPAALAEARRLAASGALRPSADEPPQQLSLF